MCPPTRRRRDRRRHAARPRPAGAGGGCPRGGHASAAMRPRAADPPLRRGVGTGAGPSRRRGRPPTAARVARGARRGPSGAPRHRPARAATRLRHPAPPGCSGAGQRLAAPGWTGPSTAGRACRPRAVPRRAATTARPGRGRRPARGSAGQRVPDLRRAAGERRAVGVREARQPAPPDVHGAVERCEEPWVRAPPPAQVPYLCGDLRGAHRRAHRAREGRARGPVLGVQAGDRTGDDDAAVRQPTVRVRCHVARAVPRDRGVDPRGRAAALPGL